MNLDSEMQAMDTSDVERWMGQPVGGEQMKDPLTLSDIRRWAQAMQNPNPLYFDEPFAAESLLGEIVAPPSFTICHDVGHGAQPSIQGNIPGSHMLFGGDEWWFPGPRIRPDDQLHSERLAFDFRVTETSFAGPTMFQRGDTTYVNQRGEVVAKQRSTSIRYLVENARRLASMKQHEAEPAWSDEDLDRVDREKTAYYETFQHHVLRVGSDVATGEALPRGVLGPHSLQSFTTEWRAYPHHVWGATVRDLRYPTSTFESGWLPEMSRDDEGAKVNPEKRDGLAYGPSRGHTQLRYARLIGMPRPYGYGASMGAWVLDYVSNWAGEHAHVVHSKIQYRSPAFAGDVTYLTGEVLDVGDDPMHLGDVLVCIEVEMCSQADVTLGKGPVTVRLPRHTPTTALD